MSAQADFDGLAALDQRIKSYNVGPNPYTWFTMEALEDTWKNLQKIIQVCQQGSWGGILSLALRGLLWVRDTRILDFSKRSCRVTNRGGATRFMWIVTPHLGCNFFKLAMSCPKLTDSPSILRADFGIRLRLKMSGPNWLR